MGVPRENRCLTKSWKVCVGVALTAILLAAVSWFVLFRINQFSLVLSLIGDAEAVLEFGEPYQEQGAAARLCGTLFFQNGIPLSGAKLHVESDLQEAVLGDYTISYKAYYGNWSAESKRIVSVVDTVAPVITILEDPENALLKDQAYLYSGFQAVDNYDGDITDRVVCSVTNGQIFYSVKDSSGNTGVAQRALPTEDMIPPSIVLVGGDTLKVTVGTYLEDPGFVATDNLDGDLTKQVTVEGAVRWLIPGNYQLTYRVTDSSGNTSSVNRSVTITAAERPEVKQPYGKVIYLTFDDGPGPYTVKLLDILDQYNIKATFFVRDNEYGSVMQEIVSRGHSIGVHSASHRYSEIYASPEAFFADMKKMQQRIYENTGIETTLLRFPGGSSNTASYYSYHGLMTFLTQAVQDAGFQYFDWNVDSGDSEDARTAQAVYSNVKKGIGEHGVSAVLMHDTQAHSVDAVEDLILWGLENEYTFLPLTSSSPGFHHTVRN